MKKRTLDLNTAERPTLELTLQDTERTTIRVTTPTEGLISEVQQLSPDIVEIIKKGDKESMDAVFDLSARLISCNLDNVTITAAELRGKYNMRLESAVLFYSAYMDFITEITNGKN